MRSTNARLGTGEASITINVTQSVALGTATLVIGTATIPTAGPLTRTPVPGTPVPTGDERADYLYLSFYFYF